jgi:hypothetical protein
MDTDLTSINSVLKKMGISDEAVKEFDTVLEGWTNNVKTTLAEDYKKKLAQTKQICIEEVEAHKATLSRGTKVFLESKISDIEKSSAKRRAIEESEAINTLKQAKALLEGINIDGAKTSSDLQAATKASEALKRQLAEANERITREMAKASKLSEIAEKSMQRQKLLESKVTSMEKVISESTAAPKPEGKTLAEAKEQKPAPAQAPKPATKKVLVEAAGKSTQPANEIDAIASTI